MLYHISLYISALCPESLALNGLGLLERTESTRLSGELLDTGSS